jgi:peroxiredoxin
VTALVLTFALALTTSDGSTGGTVAPPGSPVADFLLDAVDGRRVRLEEDVAGRTLTVLAFTSTGCPITKLLAPRLGRTEKQYRARGVRFLGVDPNIQDTAAEVATFAKDAGIEFPILLDPQHVVTDRLGVTRTTEVFVLDADFQLIYRGAVDDQYSVGAQKPAPANDYLIDALESGLAGETIDTARTDAPGCLIGRVADEGSTVTYWRDVAPILWKNCAECHRPGQPGPMELLDYDDAKGWATAIAEVTGKGIMPPWNADPRHGRFKNARGLTETEKATLARWSAGGAKEGARADAPVAPPVFADPEWAIGKPDLVVALPEEQKIPAEGVVPYRYVTVDPHLDHDVWVQQIEIRPGDRAVTHHVMTFLVPPGVEPMNALNNGDDALGSLEFAANVPGGRPIRLPDGHGRLVRAGSRFLFQLHYAPNGKATVDRTRLGMVFSRVPVTVEARTYAIVDMNIAIAPFDDAATFSVEHVFQEPARLTGLAPHMHLRGRSFRFELERAGEPASILLDVPRYDFRWQHDYMLEQPIAMRPGDKLRVTAVFDNSPANPNNPDPRKRVRWGDQTFEEMLVGFIGYDVDAAAPAKAAQGGSPR